MTAALGNTAGGMPFATGVDAFVYPQFIGYAQRAPTTQDIYNPGTRWQDNSVNPAIIYETIGAGQWFTGEGNHATTTTYGTVLLTDNSEPVATKTYADNLAILGSPVATTTTSGIGKLVSDANAVARIASTGLQAYFVQPSNLTAVMSAPGPIGDTTASTGVFTALTADGTGAVSLSSNAAGNFTVTSGDLSLLATTNSVVINGAEAVDDAVTLGSTLGGLAGTFGKSIVLTTTEANADSLSLNSSGGAILTATGAAGKDITLTCTSGSINLTAGEAIASSTVFTNNGTQFVITGAAGRDFSVVNTGGSITMSATENDAGAIAITANGGASEKITLTSSQGTGDASVGLISTAGGVTLSGGKAAATAINFTTSNAAGGITMTAGTGGILPSTTGKFTVISTDNAAQAIELHANGGTSETIRLRADQGTAATSLDFLSDVGGITLNAGLGSASAINITSSAVGGGWTLNSGTAGVTLTNTGKISLAAAAASDITVTGAFNLTLASTLGRVITTSGIAAANAITLTASNAAGGFALTSGTGGVTLTNTGVLSLAGSGASNITIATGDFSIIDTASSIILNAGEAVADAIQLVASNVAGGIDVQAGTGGFDLDTTGAISLDSALASNLTVTGAADLTLQSTAGAVNVISDEANADSINVTSAGGMNIVATGAAAKDIIVTNTNGSITLTAGESVSDAFNLTASGAASGMTLTAGTAGINFASGQIVKVTSTAAATYVLLGTDYFVSTDSSGNAISITLPAAPATGRTVVVYDGTGSAAAHNVTLDGNGKSIAFAGASAGSQVLNTAYESATLTYNGTLWLARDTI